MPHPAGQFQVTDFHLTGKPYPIITDPSRPVEWSTVNAEEWESQTGASSVQLHQVMPVLAALAMCQSGTIYQAPELSELFKSALCQSATGALSPFAHLAGWRRIPFAQWLKSSKRHLDPITVIQSFMLFMANAWMQSWSESLGRIEWRTEASCRSNWKPCDRQKRIRSRGPLRLWEQRLCKGLTSLPKGFSNSCQLVLFFGLWVFLTGSVPEFSQIRITRRISAFHMGRISKPVTFSC